MQSIEFISKSRKSFRELRRGEEKQIKELANASGFSWPTTSTFVKELIESGMLIRNTKGSLALVALNQSFNESFAGLYISKDVIYVSVIDITGKEIFFDSKNIGEEDTFYNVLEKVLNLPELSGIKAISISSDNYFDDTVGDSRISQSLWLPKKLIEKLFPEEVEHYYAKTCITNTWKWYDDYEIQDDDLNVVFSLSEDNCYYTIMKNCQIIQKRICDGIGKDKENFLENVVIPTWKAINPDNMIFITWSKEISKFTKENLSKWNDEIVKNHYAINKDFEIGEITKLVVSEQPNFSISAAIYAMYRYYGWAN